MCFSSAPKAPKPNPPPPAPPPPSAEVVDQTAIDQGTREKRRQRSLAGRQSTILAAAAQNSAPPTGQAKTALGA